MADDTTEPLELSDNAPLIPYRKIAEALDPVPFSGCGDPSFMCLFPWVGQSLATFEKVQDEVVALFDLLCGGNFAAVSPMGQIIGATSSFNVKMELTEQAAKSFLAQEKQRVAVLKWLKLARKASLIRNKIAHGQPVHAHFVMDGDGKSGAFWAPSMRDTKKVNWPNERISGWDYAWNSKQLSSYNKAFHDVYAMFLTLRESLAGLGDENSADVLDPERM